MRAITFSLLCALPLAAQQPLRIDRAVHLTIRTDAQQIHGEQLYAVISGPNCAGAARQALPAEVRPEQLEVEAFGGSFERASDNRSCHVGFHFKVWKPLSDRLTDEQVRAAQQAVADYVKAAVEEHYLFPAVKAATNEVQRTRENSDATYQELVAALREQAEAGEPMWQCESLQAELARMQQKQADVDLDLRTETAMQQFHQEQIAKVQKALEQAQDAIEEANKMMNSQSGEVQAVLAQKHGLIVARCRSEIEVQQASLNVNSAAARESAQLVTRLSVQRKLLSEYCDELRSRLEACRKQVTTARLLQLRIDRLQDNARRTVDAMENALQARSNLQPVQVQIWH